MAAARGGGSIVGSSVGSTEGSTAVSAGDGGACTAGRATVAFSGTFHEIATSPVDEGLAGHPVPGGDVGVGEVLPFLVLDLVGVLDAGIDMAPAGAADPASALEGNAALLAERDPQQIAVLLGR